MDAAHKKCIMRNLQTLMEKTQLDVLSQKLAEKGIFSEQAILSIKAKPSPQERNRELYLNIQRRGPLAFKILIHSLAESGHVDLAHLLEPNFDIQNYLTVMSQSPPMEITETDSRALSNATPPEEYYKEQEKLVVEVKPADRYIETAENKVYQMKSNPRGYALIINNIKFENNCHQTRKGAEVDARNMQDLWNGLGYKVEYTENCGHIASRKTIRIFAEKQEHSTVDSCVVVIMSHGSSDGIVTSDGQKIELEWILKMFNNANCPQLQNKPKLFFFQACRGDEVDYGVPIRLSTSIDGETPPIRKTFLLHKLPTWTDMYIVFSSIPGYVSIRDHYTGTWFVQTICSVLMDCACKDDFESMMREVNQRLFELVDDEGKRQTAELMIRGVTRKLFFNPGL